MIRRGPRQKRYVALNSVLVILFGGIGLFGLGLFAFAFIHRWQKNVETGAEAFDIFNLNESPASYFLVGSIFMIIIILTVLLLRTIYTLNHPTTVLVTIQYVNAQGDQVTITREIDDPKELEEARKEKLRGDRFQKLSNLDKEYPHYQHVESTEGLTLEYICNRFRSFASRIEGNPLYYSIDDIRRFISGLAVSKIMILQGMSGTGKTSLPVAWGKFTHVPATVVPVQPMWKERSDLIGYFNEFTGKFNESLILEKLYEATKTDKIFIVILDELNIARVEYYFAEFLSLLELPTVNERILEVTSSIGKKDPRNLKNGKLILMDNVYFVGTANNDDSTFAISDKVYDRSMVMNLDYRCEPFVGEDDYEPITLSNETFKSLVNRAKKDYALTRRGRSHIREFDKFIQQTFSITFGNRIRRQIEMYVPIYIACGGTENEALDDILAKKVLRKLESQNPVYMKSKAEELIAKLNEVFGMGEMPQCEGVIRKLANNA